MERFFGEKLELDLSSINTKFLFLVKDVKDVYDVVRVNMQILIDIIQAHNEKIDVLQSQLEEIIDLWKPKDTNNMEEALAQKTWLERYLPNMNETGAWRKNSHTRGR
ncbi:hypothetical protein H6P81_016355 [Aristolochia fimbriata]|uniref:Uncharacterized protein n=1 Tax=Aristolochia fimbriata TaxID=158543 RepID=A0AAV7EA57_ARIFI|nr:hypothetical protein H6P81_016355 [Aristolochia fimbriata]